VEKFSDRFKVILYHGDARQGVDERAHDSISVLLTKKHRKLRFGANDDPQAMPKIRLIVSGHETWRTRHGPNALMSLRPGDQTISGQSKMDPPTASEEWPQDMAGVFRVVVVDEAHALRNTLSFTHSAVEWAKADFRVLMTATPVWTHPRDFRGLLALCEPPGLSDTAERVLDPLGQQGDPWLLPEQDARRAFRFTYWAFKTYALEHNTVCQNMADLALAKAGDLVAEDDDECRDLELGIADTFAALDVTRKRADRLRELFGRYVSRNDYETSMDGIGRIGAQVPPRVAYNLLCAFSVEAQAMYEHAAKPHMEHLFVPDRLTKRMVVNGRKLRTLSLLAINPAFNWSKLVSEADNDKSKVSNPPDRLGYGAVCAKLCADGPSADVKCRLLAKRGLKSLPASSRRCPKSCAAAKMSRLRCGKPALDLWMPSFGTP
jgi:hypothetical protein